MDPIADPNPPAAVLSLEEQVARLQALLEATRQVHSTIAVDAVLEQTARILVRELEFEGAAFVAPDEADTMTHTLASYGELPEPPCADCLRVPLLGREGNVLAVLVAQPASAAPLSLYERDFLDGLCLQAAVALENATFHERDVQWARVQQDLDAARGIQRSLFPARMPAIAGYTLAARSVACYEVGGDYLDVLALPDGSTLLVVADVAGKGLASAIMATSFRAAFRSLAAQGMGLAEIAGRVGQLHWEEGNEARRRYVTAILVRIDTGGETIEAVNCGHNPGLLLGPDGTVATIDASGTPLGMLPGMGYAAETFDFPAGSRLLLYTDGLTEVFQGEEEYGFDRLRDSLRHMHRHAPGTGAQGTLDTLWAELDAFSTGGPQTDDMTAFAVSRQP